MKTVMPPQISSIKPPSPETPKHQRAERIQQQVEALRAEIEGRRKLIAESGEPAQH